MKNFTKLAIVAVIGYFATAPVANAQEQEKAEWGDFKLWKLGLKYINKQQENSRKQAQQEKLNNLEAQFKNIGSDYDSEYKRIDWNAGNRP